MIATEGIDKDLALKILLRAIQLYWSPIIGLGPATLPYTGSRFGWVRRKKDTRIHCFNREDI